ncbi:MAG: hypothetical protein ACRDJN_00335, partial [Chloroflexota bacterium]
GRALYVGKAASLRDRVAQHFSGTARALRREDGLLERTAAVEHEVAGCELDALLHESERIRTLQPPYNVQERSRRGCPFLRFEAGVFPRVATARQVTAETLYAGPYHTTQAVRHTIQTLRRVFQLRSCRRILPAKRAAMRVPCLRLGQGLCLAPCAEMVTPEQYAVLVEYARLFVAAGKLATLDALDARLATLEGEGAVEGWEYRTLRECRLRLWRIRREHRPIDGGLAGDDLLMAYPAADGGATLFFVRDGRLMRRVRIPAGHADRACLIPVIEQCLRADGPEAEAPLDADQANIVLRWIYRHTGRPELIPITSETSVSDVGAAVEGVLGT